MELTLTQLIYQSTQWMSEVICSAFRCGLTTQIGWRKTLAITVKTESMNSTASCLMLEYSLWKLCNTRIFTTYLLLSKIGTIGSKFKQQIHTTVISGPWISRLLWPICRITEQLSILHSTLQSGLTQSACDPNLSTVPSLTWFIVSVLALLELCRLTQWLLPISSTSTVSWWRLRMD